MQVTLKRNVTVEGNKIKLNKGDIGWLQAVQIRNDGDVYLLQINGHSYVPVSRYDIEFPRTNPQHEKS